MFTVNDEKKIGKNRQLWRLNRDKIADFSAILMT
jgi:hypothetical protein